MRQIEYKLDDYVFLLSNYDKSESFKIMMKYYNKEVPTIDRGFDEGEE